MNISMKYVVTRLMLPFLVLLLPTVLFAHDVAEAPTNAMFFLFAGISIAIMILANILFACRNKSAAAFTAVATTAAFAPFATTTTGFAIVFAALAIFAAAFAALALASEYKAEHIFFSAVYYMLMVASIASVLL